VSTERSTSPDDTADTGRIARLVGAIRGEVGLPAARMTLERFGGSSLRPALLEMLDDATALTRVAARSYRHANGFVKVVLHESEALKLRLHIAEGTAEENVHDHRWDFASTVLSGRLEHDIFTDVPANCGEHFHEWQYLRTESSAESRYLGDAWVSQSLWQTVAAGQSYALRGVHLHRIRWAEPGTSTLVATFRSVRASTRLLSPTASLPTTHIEPLSASDLESVLRLYLHPRERN
jgi:hypothetical protein